MRSLAAFLDDMGTQQRLRARRPRCMGFLEQGIFGRIGCAGLVAVKHRQQENTSVMMNSALLCASFSGQAEFEVLCCFGSSSCRHWRVPHCLAQQRRAAPRDVRSLPAIYDMWPPGDKVIAQLELLIVLLALIARPSMLLVHRQHGGTHADSPDLERVGGMIHAAVFALRAWWIPSKSNWADQV